MEKFDGLEQKFDQLLRHLHPQHKPQTQTNPTPRKRKSDKHLYKNSGGRRIHNSDAGTTTPTSEPPDPGSHQTTTTTVHTPNQMDTDNKTIEGGINDDDLSEQMIQHWEDTQSTDSAMSASPVANRKKND